MLKVLRMQKGRAHLPSLGREYRAVQKGSPSAVTKKDFTREVKRGMGHWCSWARSHSSGWLQGDRRLPHASRARPESAVDSPTPEV